MKKMEKVKQHKRLLIVVSTLVILALIVTAVYWQTAPQNPQPSPSPTPTPTPSSSPAPSPSPSQTPSSSSSPSPTPTLTPTPTVLPSQEIREYQGEDLSAIADFRENSIAGPQHIDEDTYRLTVTGLVNETKEYTYNQVVNGFQNYQKVVTLYCVEGWSVKILWEGFLVKDLLNYTQIDPNATVVIFHAYDGYTTALSFNYILDNNILIAYKMNGLTLPLERGFPFELVAESKYGYKWIKWITQIELSDNADYLGYWESRGWPNDANLP
jgi:DMSO/TMAO reductase YedYZ molybdopterin-dependent catalytic subunit